MLTRLDAGQAYETSSARRLGFGVVSVHLTGAEIGHAAGPLRPGANNDQCYEGYDNQFGHRNQVHRASIYRSDSRALSVERLN
jgi:hypothetical protein